MTVSCPMCLLVHPLFRSQQRRGERGSESSMQFCRKEVEICPRVRLGERERAAVWSGGSSVRAVRACPAVLFFEQPVSPRWEGISVERTRNDLRQREGVLHRGYAPIYRRDICFQHLFPET